MTDDQLEQLLRASRPAGPPPELRARIVAVRDARRAWPWVAAAAALLALTISLHSHTGEIAAAAVPRQPAPTDERFVAEVTERIGSDEYARAVREWIRESEQRRVRSSPADSQ